MTTGKELGRMAYHSGLEKCQQIREVHVRQIEADIKKRRALCELRMKVASEEQIKANDELASRGNISEEVMRENIWRAVLAIALLSLCVPGEFVFAVWTVACFGLGTVESILIATAIVILSLESVDFCIEFLRKQYRSFDNQILMVFACMGFLTIFVLIFFAAEIRQSLQAMYHTIASASLEQTVQKADSFFNHNSRSFILLMVSLTTTFTIIGGMSYHIAKNRILVYLPFRRLHRRLDRIRNDLQKAAEEMAEQDSKVALFLAEFETGVAQEEQEVREKQAKESDEKSRNNQNPLESKDKPVNRIQHFYPHFIPIILIILALALFLVLRGEARGSDYIILLDLSRSADVNGYTGIQTEFTKNVSAIEYFIRNHVSPGDELKVIAITESSFSRPYTLLDARVSPQKGAFGEVLSRERLRLLNQWKTQDLKPTAKATDILGAVNLAAILFPQKAGKKDLIIFSDMRQCSEELNLETPQKIDFHNILPKIKSSIPNLKGAKVSCLGVHSAGKNPVYWLSLKQFWEEYFKKAGADLITFSIERSYRHE